MLQDRFGFPAIFFGVMRFSTASKRMNYLGDAVSNRVKKNTENESAVTNRCTCTQRSGTIA